MTTTLAYADVTPEVRAIWRTLDYAQLPYQVEPLDEGDVELRLPEEGATIRGWRAVFVYASRLAHTYPSAPTGAAFVEEWLNAPWDEAARAATLDRMETALAAHGKTYLCDCDLNLSTAADFLWVARLADVPAAELEARPCVAALAATDPGMDDRGHESEPEEEPAPDDYVRSSCALM